ncbi:allantoinase-like isoform X4 [Malus sylvestris]|uniref:allantoinase-like isoform X4 n=1 Tax=Malus sylvestris TaxID=3752 RepID=UPI0021AD0D57|nr:allantoinase-like isoform X4 [Malus sylvestris]
MKAVQWRILPLLTLIASFIVFFYFQYPSQQYQNSCSLLPFQHYWIASKRIVTPQGVISGAVEIMDGKIASIVKEEEKHGKIRLENVMDYGEAVVMPGLIDVHAHLDDPGRAEWEGFPSGTKAAAAGGITTLVDMPLNSEPSTVSRETLELKIKAAKSRIYVDVGFWGGLVPENAFNASALEDLLDAGVLGLKSFMCPSGINDFPMTNASHIKEGLAVLAKYRRPLLVHAEKAQELESDLGVEGGSNDPRCYLTYLKTRPPSWEEAAIRDLLTLTKDTRIGGLAEGAHLHIVHLSDARSSLDLIKDGHVDMLSSDHSPTVPELKLLNDGDFLRAWGGISSLQGAIAVGNHADIAVWDPDVEFDLGDEFPTHVKHPGISAYLGTKLSGRVAATFVRGNLVFKEGKHAPALCGIPILAN